MKNNHGWKNQISICNDAYTEDVNNCEDKSKSMHSSEDGLVYELATRNSKLEVALKAANKTIAAYGWIAIAILCLHILHVLLLVFVYWNSPTT